MLRQFLYLDEELVREFLGQAEGGVYAERKHTEETSRTGKVGGKLGVGPIGAELGGASQGLERSELTVVQTGPSEFDRLRDYLEDKNELAEISDLDERSWAELRRGSFAEVDGDVRLSGMTTMGNLAEAASGFLSFAEVFGQNVDEDTRAKLAVVRQLAPAGGIVPVAVHVVGTPKFKFRAKLDKRAMRVSVGELAGEAIIFGKVGRKLTPRQTLPLDEILPGMEFVKPADRRKLERELRSTEIAGSRLGEMSLGYPAADFIVVAIYR